MGNENSLFIAHGRFKQEIITYMYIYQVFLQSHDIRGGKGRVIGMCSASCARGGERKASKSERELARERQVRANDKS